MRSVGFPFRCSDARSKKTLVHHLTARPTPIVPDYKTPLAPEESHSITHPEFQNLLAMFPDLVSFTLRDTFIFSDTDVVNIVLGLEKIRPRKVRIELRCWDLYDSQIGRDLLAATSPYTRASCQTANTPVPPTPPISSSPPAQGRPAPIPEGNGDMLHAWHIALRTGRELHLPSHCLDPTVVPPGHRAQPRPPHRPQNPASQAQLLRTAMPNADVQPASSLTIPPSDWLIPPLQTSTSHQPQSQTSAGQAGLPDRPGTTSSQAIDVHYDAGDDTDEDPEVDETNKQGRDTHDSLEPQTGPQSPSQDDGSGFAEPIIDPTTDPSGLEPPHLSRSPSAANVPVADNIHLFDPNQQGASISGFGDPTALSTMHASVADNLDIGGSGATTASRDRDESAGALVPADNTVREALNGSPSHATFHHDDSRTDRMGVFRSSSSPPQTHACDVTDMQQRYASDNDPPIRVITSISVSNSGSTQQSGSQSTAIAIPGHPLERGYRRDHIYIPPGDDDLAGPADPPTAGPSGTSGRSDVGTSVIPINEPTSARMSAAQRRSARRATVMRPLARNSGIEYNVAHTMRDELQRLITERWAGRIQAFSFVAFDPVASLVVRAPRLDFWVNMPIEHIRVHLPRGVNSLAVFKGPKECERDRIESMEVTSLPLRAVTITDRVRLRNTTSPPSEVTVVGGDGFGGGLVHPSNHLFEIEVNSVSEMMDDTWSRAGAELPPQVCRILQGDQDWSDVVSGRCPHSIYKPCKDSS